MKSYLYNVFILKSASITNISIEDYMEEQRNKQKTKNKHSLKDSIDYFFNFPCKNFIHDKIILFHTTFLVQKA